MGFFLLFKVVLPSKIAVSGNKIIYKPSAPMSPAVRLIDTGGPSETIASFRALDTDIKPLKRYEPSAPFLIPQELKRDVEFWKMVYSKYTTDQAIFHNPYDLGIVYGAINIPHCGDTPSKECLKLREDVMQAEKDRLMIKHHPDLIGKVDSLKFIRAQIGQRDKFIEGIARAKPIIKDIEKIFTQNKIPKQVTRLAMVESMFDANAKSGSGALGIWQLMKGSAKHLGLRINRNVDERKDPIKSTVAAVKHLRRDFDRLGSWPLAINAYNTGPRRIAEATEELKTKNIAKIIKKYEHPSYGFASRNFYPEFLAALEVYEDRKLYFGNDIE